MYKEKKKSQLILDVRVRLFDPYYTSNWSLSEVNSLPAHSTFWLEWVIMSLQLTLKAITFRPKDTKVVKKVQRFLWF